MIFKSLGVAIVLFLAYNAKVYIGLPSQAWGQNQFQNNIIKAQEYVYLPQKTSALVVGSSISAGLSLPIDRFQVLSLRAGSGYEGLKVLQKKLPQPESIVLVEVNTLLLPTKLDDAFADELFSPFFRELRQVLPALQEKNQPVTLLMPTVMQVWSKLLPANPKPAQPKQLPTVAPLVAKSFQINEMRVAKIKQMVESIEAGKAKVVFFEVPQGKGYAESEKRKLCLERLKQTFPTHTFLDLPTHYAYASSDGVHLDWESSLQFTDYFQTTLQKLQLIK